jgi:beta-mannosidase
MRPRVMGSLYWQLNDCWPVASWASIDYFGRWKALHYYARRFYNDVLVSPDRDNGTVAVYVVSDRTLPLQAHLRGRLVDFTGRTLWARDQDVTVPPLASKSFWSLAETELLSGHDPKNAVLVLDLTANGRLLSRNTQWFDRPKNTQLPPAQVRATLHPSGKNYVLQVASPQYARDVYVTFGDLDATVSDNYFDLLANEPLTLTVTSSAPMAELQRQMKVVSLVDAFGASPRSPTSP